MYLVFRSKTCRRLYECCIALHAWDCCTLNSSVVVGRRERGSEPKIKAIPALVLYSPERINTSKVKPQSAPATYEGILRLAEVENAPKVRNRYLLKKSVQLKPA